MLHSFNVFSSILQSLTDGQIPTLDCDELEFKHVNPKAFIKVCSEM